ncbi:acyl-CoA N-acyltransferase [Sistotremastrum niveocremeum HHB9708]|uniref:Acyl-CoA N-acyltransferase n=1 Tax=Sistotremastrum niveocremeum HHB9708 TaxID=1314777 RepID=A0A164PES4_9AGAM|nr:acyl-CoA N-acyltransferase [Sistotremastrum niveocremeum HHB9708]
MYQHRSDLIIRPAEDPDAPFLMELINIAYRGEQGWTDGLDNIKAPRIELDDLRARISGSEENDSARRNAPIFVAVLQPEGVVAGCIQPYNSAKDSPHGSNANSEANLEHPLTIQGHSIACLRFRDRCFGSPGRRDWAKTAKSNRAQIQSPTSSLPSTLNGIDPHLFTPLARLNLSTSLNALLIDELHLDYVGLQRRGMLNPVHYDSPGPLSDLCGLSDVFFLIILEYIFRVCMSQKERAEILGKQISRVEWFSNAVDEDWQRTDLKKLGTSRGYGRGAGYTVGYIELFAVHPDYQSRGIGKSLLNFALDHMKEAWNVSVCVIYVFEIRPKVLAWYEKLGFTWDGRTVPAYEFQHLMINPDIVLRILEKQL